MAQILQTGAPRETQRRHPVFFAVQREAANPDFVKGQNQVEVDFVRCDRADRSCENRLRFPRPVTDDALCGIVEGKMSINRWVVNKYPLNVPIATSPTQRASGAGK